MYYIVLKQNPVYEQMTLEEYLFGTSNFSLDSRNNKTSNTRTYTTDKVNDRLLMFNDIGKMIEKLEDFNRRTDYLREQNRNDLYYSFYIPKKSGGLRKIDAPNDDLKTALRYLKNLFENEMNALYHTSSFAYVKGRCAVDAVKRHQSNESRWFAKLDLSNFFGTTTQEFVMQQFSMIFPFCEIVKTERGRIALETALSLAFKDGVLPQGTPISPLITNVMMIPIDHILSNKLRNFETVRDGVKHMQRYVYTRYADDFIISSRYDFNVRDIENVILSTLNEFNAPFILNREKTRYGSSAGSNWNLGVMLNKDNKITIGHQKRRQFKAMLCSYILDKKNGRPWELHDVQVLEGLRNYYRSVERETIDGDIGKLNEKYHVNIIDLIYSDLRT